MNSWKKKNNTYFKIIIKNKLLILMSIRMQNVIMFQMKNNKVYLQMMLLLLNKLN